MPITINLNDVQVKPIVVNADLTAVLDRTYNVVASAIFTDPTPTEGKGFIVFVRNGTATVGGVGYSTAGTVIGRIYHSGAWANYTGTSVDVNTIGAAINGAASGTPNDTDLVMSVDTSVAKKNTWTQIKAFLKTYFDTVYATVASLSGKEDTSNKSDSYTASSTTTYANTKALVDGLATKVDTSDSRLTDTRINRAVFKQNLTLSHTGDTTNTLKYSSLIAGGTFNANDLLKFAALIGATSNANAKTFRFYFNTSASLSGATLIATHALSSGALTVALSRFMIFKNSVSSQEISPASVAFQSEYVASSSAPTALTINFTVDQYFIVAMQLGNSADTAYVYGLTSELYR